MRKKWRRLSETEMPKSRLKKNLGLPSGVRHKHGAYRYRPNTKEINILNRTEITLGRGDEFDAEKRSMYDAIKKSFLLGEPWESDNAKRHRNAGMWTQRQWKVAGYRKACGIPLEGLQKIHNSSKSSKHVYNLSPRDIVNLANLARGRCELTGLKWDYRRYGKSGKMPFAASLDRIDARKGYERDNVRLVCVMANFALADFGDKAWRKFAAGITKLELN